MSRFTISRASIPMQLLRLSFRCPQLLQKYRSSSPKALVNRDTASSESRWPHLDMDPDSGEPKPLSEKQRNGLGKRDTEIATSVEPTVRKSSQQTSREGSLSLPSPSDPEKGLPRTTIERKDSDNPESKIEAEVDPDLVSGRTFAPDCAC